MTQTVGMEFRLGLIWPQFDSSPPLPPRCAFF